MRLQEVRGACTGCARTLAYAERVSQVAFAVYTTQNTVAWHLQFDAYLELLRPDRRIRHP